MSATQLGLPENQGRHLSTYSVQNKDLDFVGLLSPCPEPRRAWMLRTLVAGEPQLAPILSLSLLTEGLGVAFIILHTEDSRVP